VERRQMLSKAQFLLLTLLLVLVVSIQTALYYNIYSGVSWEMALIN